MFKLHSYIVTIFHTMYRFDPGGNTNGTGAAKEFGAPFVVRFALKHDEIDKSVRNVICGSEICLD